MADIVPHLEGLAEKINAEHAQVISALREGLAHALECGRLLIEAKERISHGGWLIWLQEHCPEISERQAQRYMRVTRDLSRLENENATRVSDLSFRQALELIANNAKAARRFGVEAVEDRAVDIPGALFAKQVHDRQEERRQRQQHKRMTQEKQRQAQDAQARHEEFGVPPPEPARTDNRWNLLGLDESELAVLLEELTRSAQWYEGLVGRLSSDYEYAVPRLARDAASAIWKLRERLTYDRDQLQHAVYGLNELLAPGPVLGKEVRSWARRAGISRGLLALGGKILGVRKSWRDGGPDWWSLPDGDPLPA